MKTHQASLALTVAMALIALPLSSAAAQGNLPKSGSIHLHSGAGSTYVESEVAEKRIQGTGTDNGVTYNDRGSGPLHVGALQCSYAYMSVDGKGRHKGYCTWSDADSDRIYTDFEGTGAIDGTSSGMNQITGGTGKYAGVTGSGPYECQGVGRSGTHCKVRLDYKLP